MNGTIDYYEKIGLGPKKYQSGKLLHNKLQIEKEAIFVEFLKLLKDDKFYDSVRFLKHNEIYFENLFKTSSNDKTGFKEFVKKAYQFGITKEQIEKFKTVLEEFKYGNEFKKEFSFLFP
jgi:hypothetical protein